MFVLASGTTRWIGEPRPVLESKSARLAGRGQDLDPLERGYRAGDVLQVVDENPPVQQVPRRQLIEGPIPLREEPTDLLTPRLLHRPSAPAPLGRSARSSRSTEFVLRAFSGGPTTCRTVPVSWCAYFTQNKRGRPFGEDRRSICSRLPRDHPPCGTSVPGGSLPVSSRLYHKPPASATKSARFARGSAAHPHDQTGRLRRSFEVLHGPLGKLLTTRGEIVSTEKAVRTLAQTVIKQEVERLDPQRCHQSCDGQNAPR